MNRALSIVVLAGFLLPAPARAGHEVLREQSSKVVESRGVTAVRVENPRGDVRVSRSADGRIHVTALKLVRTGTRASSERLASEMQVETEEQAGRFEIRVHYPTRQSIRIGFWDLFHDFEFPTAEVRVGLELPAGMPLAVRTLSGDVSTAGLDGGQTIETTSGHVEIDAATGAVQVESTSGDLEANGLMRAQIRSTSGDVDLADVRGALWVHTTSGDLVIRGAADSLDLGTVSGDIRVVGAPRGLRVTTTSGKIVASRVSGWAGLATSNGDVDLSAVGPLSGVDVGTGSGDIRVRLGPGAGGTLELRTSNGSLQLDAPIKVGTLTRRLITGQFGNGTANIRLRSASGDIHVSTGESGS